MVRVTRSSGKILGSAAPDCHVRALVIHMKVAAHQSPLLRCGSMEAIELIRERVKWCESEVVAILCCPEAILGSLADYAPPLAISRLIWNEASWPPCLRRLRIPVFTVGGMTFEIITCNDSNFLEPARIMAAKGATALFVATNNGLPANRSNGPRLASEKR